jgi:manganese efflux pump family protein
MTPLATLILAFGMSVDAFAAAIGKGAALHRPRLSEALRTGLIFGLVETLTPILGWALGLTAASYVDAVDHWLAFVILGLVGGRMIWGALRTPKPVEQRPQRHALGLLLATAFGTSIDAAAVGVTLAFIGADIARTALAIGAATFLMATAGMLIGRYLGVRLGRVAEGLGGVGLILLGAKILTEHLMMG